MVTINGERVNGLVGQQLTTLLDQYASNQENVVVELNGQIIHREAITDILLNENDHVELISFVGGG